MEDIAVVRFRVSGEPFDIPTDILCKWPDTALMASAQFALKNGPFADGVPVVVLPRDIRAFRVLRHYMETGEIITPPDPVDRQLLIAEAGFYAFPAVVQALMAGAQPATPAHAPADAQADAKADAQADAKADAKDGKPAWTFFQPGTVNEIHADDSAIRAAELPARMKFAASALDESKLVKVVDIFGTSGSLGSSTASLGVPAAGPDYPKLAYPGIPIAPLAYVATRDEFRAQLRCLTMGLADEIKDLPLVVAGGVVLAALHKLPRADIPPEASCRFAKVPAKALMAHFVEAWRHTDYGGGRRFRYGRHNRDQIARLTAEHAKLRKLLTERGALPAPARTSKENENTLSLLAWLTGASWDLEGNMSRGAGGQGADCIDTEDSPDYNLVALQRLSDLEIREAMMENTKSQSSDIDTIPARGPPGSDINALVGGIGDAALETPARRGPPGSNMDALTSSDEDAKLELPPHRSPPGSDMEAVSTGDAGDTKNAGSMPLEHTGDQLIDLERVGGLPKTVTGPVCGEHVTAATADTGMLSPKGAGEAGSKRALHTFKETDIDLFLTTRDPIAAIAAIEELHRRILKLLPPDSAVEIVRTERSVTFIPPLPYRRVQVILRLYHSVAQVLLGFDIDACCVAFDGDRVVALPRAVRALRTRTVLVDTSRQSTTYEARLLKYAKRGFAIAVPGLDVVARMADVVREVCDGYLRPLRLTGAALLLAMLYSVAQNDKHLRKQLGVKLSDYGGDPYHAQTKVRDAAMKGYKTPFVTGTNIAKVLRGSISVVRVRWGQTAHCESLLGPISFRTETPHAQDRTELLFTGAFHPTSSNWY